MTADREVKGYQSLNDNSRHVVRSRPINMYEMGEPQRLQYVQSGKAIKNGISPAEFRVGWNAVWLMARTAQEEGLFLIAVTLGDELYNLDYASRWVTQSEIRKQIRCWQTRSGIPQYAAMVVEMLPGMHFHIIGLGNDKILSQLRASPMIKPYVQGDRAIQVITDEEGGWPGKCNYVLSKEAMAQTHHFLEDKGIPLQDRKPPIRAPYAGDRVILSDQLRRDAAATPLRVRGEYIPLIPAYTATNWSREAMRGVMKTELSPRAVRRAMSVQAAPKAAVAEATVKPVGQLSLFPEMERQAVRLADFISGILSPSAALELEFRRKRSGYTKTELARITGVSRPQIANAVSARYGLSRDAANRLKMALGVAA